MCKPSLSWLARPLSASAGLAAVLWAASHDAAGFGGTGGTVCGQPGPDAIIGDINFQTSYAAEQVEGETFDAFSVGRTICNIGDEWLLINAFPSAEHPVYGQNLFQLKDGRFEQVGMSWLAHGFFVLANNICGCGCDGMSGSVLGAGCSDPSTASRGGTQAALGPRWQVNAFTGVFPTGGPANPPFSGTTARRLRVKSTELEPSGTSVQHYVEVHVVSAHEAGLANQNNNTSYRPVTINAVPPLEAGDFIVAVSGSTHREQAGIRAWKAADDSVLETDIQLPDDGLLILAAKATDLGGGTWHYEYALQNVNADRSVRSFSIPLPAGATITNIGFHDVDYHSGDGIPLPDGPDPDTDPDWRNFDGTDWKAGQSSDSVTWSTQAFAENENANALRWGTLYNFRFDADRPPVSGDVVLSTFKVEGSVAAATIVPGPLPCPIDLTGDGHVNVDDLLAVINAWGTSGGSPADIDQDGAVDVDDLLAVINAWGACP